MLPRFLTSVFALLCLAAPAVADTIYFTNIADPSQKGSYEGSFDYDPLHARLTLTLTNTTDPSLGVQAVLDHLARRGILVKPTQDYGLADCLRITVGREDENRALVAALGEILS